MSEIAAVAIAREPDVRPSAIMDLRVHSGLPSEVISVWEDRLADAQAVVTARDPDSSALLGAGFVMGDREQAELAYVSVQRDQAGKGITGMLGREMLKAAQEIGAERVTFTCQGDPFDHDKPVMTQDQVVKVRQAGFAHEGSMNTWVKVLTPEV